MSRNTTIFLWLCLLSWLPITSFGQTLTQYEYWFDDNFGDRTSGSLSGYTALFDQEVDASSLSNGIHKFSFRVKQSDGHYSAVTSSLFLKVITGGGTTMEYWFDDKIDQRVSQDIASDDAIQEFDLDLHDDKIFPTGFHKLNIRVNIDNQASAIYSTGVYKFPVGSATRLDYWIDNNTDDIKTLPAKAANDGSARYLFHDDCDLSGVSIGFHKVNMRAIIDGVPSAVYTANVYKLPMGSGAKLEYWLDDNIQDAQPIDGRMANDGSARYLFHDDCDLSGASIGFHKLNLRVTIDGQPSAVYTTNVYKLPMGSGAKFEYWLDGNTDDIKTLTPKIANNGSATYLIHDDCDLTGASIGFHKLNMRVTIDGQPSAVYSTGVYKMPEGNLSKLEYWFDNDKTIRTIPGTMSNDGTSYRFIDDLDIDGLAPGHHRLYCRAVSEDRLISSAITSTPVVVKTKYDADPADVKVTSYSIVVDNEEPLEFDVHNLKPDITIPYTLDVHDLSTGPHNLKATFYNSFNAGVSIEQQFMVSEEETPSLILTAEEMDGHVLLQYNAVPNDLISWINRVDGNGVNVKVYENLYGRYSSFGTSFTDTPSAGDYTYYAQMKYEDFSGTEHELISNEVTVSVAHSQDELKSSGYIVGMVQQNVVSPKFMDICFSDGVYVSSVDGKFHRDNIPVGKELTLEVVGGSSSSLALVYEPVTVTIHEGENFVYIKGQTEEDIAPNNYNYDLAFDSDIEWIGSEFKFMVKNRTRKQWKGHVRFRAISEKNAKLEEYATVVENEDFAQNTAGNMADLSVVNNYYFSYSDLLTIDAGKSALVSLSLENVFPDYNKDYYIFYIESNGGWTSDTDKSWVVKPVDLNYDYNVTKNPMTRLIDKSILAKAEEQVLLENVEYAANLLLMVCSKIKAFDGILGNLDEYFDGLLKESKKLADFEADKLERYLDNAFETESFEELLTDEMVQLIPKAVLGHCGSAIVKKLREDIKSDMLSKVWDQCTLKDIIHGSKIINDYLSDAMKMLKFVQGYKSWKDLSSYDRHFYCARAILEYTEKVNPFADLMKTYVDVADAYINKALEYGEELYGWYEAGYLYNNIPFANESNKFEYNKYVNFKIEVQTSCLVDFSFKNFPYGHGISAIKEVKVMLSNRNEEQVDTIYFQPIGTLTGVMLKQTKYIGMDPYKMGLPQGNIDGGVPLKRFWMEIKWSNGRTSKVPLLNRSNKTNGVELIISPTDPYEYIIRFKSGTTRYENIADDIELKL